MTDRKRVLLLSSSTVFGSGYLDHAETEIRDFFGGIARLLFVPFALHDHDAYAARTRERFAGWAMVWIPSTRLRTCGKR